jgi:hypothetical protein
MNADGVVNGLDVDPFVNALLGVLVGDVNLDGEANGLDVSPFVSVVLNGGFQREADLNFDGNVDGLDVDPFVAAVMAGGVQAVPEPSPIVLATLGVLGVIGFYRRRRAT